MSISSIDQAIDVLNDMLRLDPHATERMFFHRFFCGEALAEHPTIQAGVWHDANYVSVLGLINGLFGVDETGWGPITMVSDNYTGKILGFRRTTGWPNRKDDQEVVVFSKA